jgi:hypothetical protein
MPTAPEISTFRFLRIHTTTRPPPNHDLSPGMLSCSNSQHAFFTSCITCSVHVRCLIMPTVPGLDHFSRRKNRLFAFCVHTLPRDHHPSTTSSLGCRGAPLSTPTANSVSLHHIMYIQRVAMRNFRPFHVTHEIGAHQVWSQASVAFAGNGGGVGGERFDRRKRWRRWWSRDLV